MPTAERLATDGLKYTRFHTTAVCSASRAALLSGRNHHTVGMGSITEVATSAPGQNSMRPNTCAPLAEILRLNGYWTAQFGKCHEVPAWETSPAGPFDRWPTGSGFEHFYGFIAGETNQWYPALHEDVSPVEPWGTPDQGYHLMPDLADKSIAWMQQQSVLMPDKPFFLYFAPGATHAPHHVPLEWADKYKGQFDQGWDRLREETFARQKQLGVIPEDAELTARPSEIPAWDEMDPHLKPVLIRQMEVYAGFLEYADYHTGRLIDAMADLDLLDNTLVYYIIGDNGASAEGTLSGAHNELATAEEPGLESPEYLLERIDQLGTPLSYNHYAVGWAHAMDTPYQWTKQIASHWGGTRNGTIVHWPQGIAAKGEVRNQFTHVIDVAPTVLEVAGLPAPTLVHGVMQEPMHGVSMAYSFDQPDAPEQHQSQYFEILCNRGIYHKGWSAVTRHHIPWEQHTAGVPLDEDVWELYDGATDWTQARNLAAEHPEKLAELQRLFLIEAGKYNVLPLDTRMADRFNAELAGRPQLITGNSLLLYPGMRSLTENCMLNLKNKSHAMTADITVPDGGASGVLVNQGGLTGGWVLYLKDGHLAYHYNFLGLQRASIVSAAPVPAGQHEVRMAFTYDGGGLGKGGVVTLVVDGVEVGTGRVERTHAFMFSFDETTDVGRDTGSSVCDDYPINDNAFTGTIKWIRLDVGTDDHGHLIEPRQLHNLAMARQ